MSLNPYLAFRGNCREAFEFYRTVFGGEFGLVSTFREAPDDWEVPAEELDLILHMALPVGNSVLMGCDIRPFRGPAPEAGTNFAIVFEAQHRQLADEVFAGLAAGGEIRVSMGDTFWGAYFGVVVDQFGFQWQVMTQH